VGLSVAQPLWAQIIIFILWLFMVLLIARVVLDFVQMFARHWEPKGIVLYICEAIYTVTDPPVKALRKLIPPLRLGGITLDLSILLLFILIQVLMRLVEMLGSRV
jgi:YggT family protein